MPLHNGPNGYGNVTKALHWVTFLALSAQFTVGYFMDVDDSGRGHGRGRGGDSDGSGQGRGRGGDDDLLSDGGNLLTVHVALGLLILTLAVVRVTWRRIDGLPPWAEALSHGQRRLAHWTEKALLVLIFAIPQPGSRSCWGTTTCCPCTSRPTSRSSWLSPPISGSCSDRGSCRGCWADERRAVTNRTAH